MAYNKFEESDKEFMDGSKCAFNVQEEVNNIKRESEDKIQKVGVYMDLIKFTFLEAQFSVS
ncbi:1939_t:CDS:2, partial [Dentiscutata erythropus]